MFFTKRKFYSVAIFARWLPFLMGGSTTLTCQNAIDRYATAAVSSSQAKLHNAHLLYRSADYSGASTHYWELINGEKYPPHIEAEALFWAIRCLQQLDPTKNIQPLQTLLATKYPTSIWTAQDYLSKYTADEYLRGVPKALKHLKSLRKAYPSNPLQIVADLILGWHAQNGYGKQVRWQAAINAFAHAEATWLRLQATGYIPVHQHSLYKQLYWRAKLARGQTLLAMVQGNPQPGQSDTLHTAIAIFQELRDTPLQLPALYHLARSCHYCQAEPLLIQTALDTIQLCKQNTVDHHIALVYAHQTLGRQALAKMELNTAIECFQKAEQALASHDQLSTQTLDLWLQQSICWHKLGNHSAALKLLSQIVNSHLASAIRIQAMYLRATIYAQMGNIPLATKQLESIARKGGVWKHRALTALSHLRTAS